MNWVYYMDLYQILWLGMIKAGGATCRFCEANPSGSEGSDGELARNAGQN